MTALRQIFAKPVDRPIDGVIKADDEASLRTELEEYVITSEISQRLEQFLDAYNNYSTSNGVWISGFFGSGKSHLLKMLALLLENRDVDGMPAFDIFADKLVGNPILSGGLRKAVSIPSKSILFNIDQKADVISKTETDALLSVFQKVFDEMCGYFGKLPHIAQFERHLDSRGVLETFKSSFEEISGKSWERGREQALMEKRNIAAAFAQATGSDASDAQDILSQYRTDHKVSIEDFAATVKAWIDTQEKGFRLNFFVDEVGQYIADNVKLMTNLQTIAESLNTKCMGQAWIIVTAQQDMASVIGDMTAQQENDFSKIQARFANRMPLNSADVAEVIQRRLLSKTDEGVVVLGNLFDHEENNLKTLFDFSDGSIRLKNFDGRDKFISSYPFPPYQYTLFQMALSSLSQHNAFEGKHSSVGERSMLGVFQEVSKHLADNKVGEIATFDLMFEGIRSALKSSAQQSIQIAEKNLDDAYAVRVLKALFLVKYVKEFKPTVRNIGILLLEEFDQDLAAQKRKIEEALATLERNTLIQRNGEVYEFLTNEEKDVEAEIKGLDVDHSEIAKELEGLIFDAIIKTRKIKHVVTGHDYAFSRKLDDMLVGRDYELSINVFTPFSEEAGSPEAVRMQNMSREELAVVLRQDDRFIRDLNLFKKTDKFVKQARTGAPQPGRDRLVSEKGEQNGRRYKDLETRLRKLISEARLFVRGDEIDIATEDPQDRINKAFQTLVDKVYVNLTMLRGVSYSESDLTKAASPDQNLFGEGGAGLTEPEQEVFNHVQNQARLGVRVSAKDLASRFGTKPFGWPEITVLCVTAGLVGKGKLEARSDSTVLEGDALVRGLKNSNMLANILMTPQVEFTGAQVRKLKDMYKEFFDSPPEGNDAKSVGKEWSEGLQSVAGELNSFLAQVGNYPFLNALNGLQTKVSTLTGKPAAWYVTELAKEEDTLLDAKEDVLDKVRQFMSGAQKGIYDDVRTFLTQQDANFAYVGQEIAEGMKTVLDDPKCYAGSAIQNLKTQLRDLKTAVELKVVEERKSVEAELADCRAKLEQVPEFLGLTQDKQDNILARINAKANDLGAVTHIAVLRERAHAIRSSLLSELLSEVARIGAPPPSPPAPPTSGGEGDNPTPPTPQPKPKPDIYVNASQLKATYDKAYLADSSDVDQYLEEMRKTLMAEINQGKKVIV